MLTYKRFLCFAAACLAAASTLPLAAQPPATPPAAGYDPAPAWPLCGYDTLAATPFTCPSSEWDEPDIVNDTYGPRCKNSRDPLCAGGEHDWHFGVDLHAEADQMPVFASSCGRIEELDDNGGINNNKKVIIEHFRSWAAVCPDPTDPTFSFPSCDGGECYYTVYHHLSSIDFAGLTLGDFVAKAQFLGLTGQNCNVDYPCFSSSGNKRYEHVHFEVLDPTGAGLYDTSYPDADRVRNAVHPLRFLKLPEWDDDAHDLQVTIVDPGLANPMNPQPEVEVEIDFTNVPRPDRELDLARVEIDVYDASTLETTGLVWIDQFNETFPDFPTPEDHPGGGAVMYEVNPPFFDMETWVRQYSYSNSKPDYDTYLSEEHFSPPDDDPADHPYKTPYSLTQVDGQTNALFDPGLLTLDSNGDYDYRWGYHLHLAMATAPERGEFNGVQVLTEPYNRTDDFYRINLKWTELEGMASADDLCLKARAWDVYGNVTETVTHGHCDVPPDPVADLLLEPRCTTRPNEYRVSWTASPWTDEYRVYLMPMQDEPHTVPETPRPHTTTDLFFDFGIATPVWVWVEACNAFGCSAPLYAGYADYVGACM